MIRVVVMVSIFAACCWLAYLFRGDGEIDVNIPRRLRNRDPHWR